MAVTNGYATGADAQALFNVLGGVSITFGAATTPTLTQVEGWLDALAAEVDALLRANGYGEVPATGTNDVQFIGRFVAQKGAAVAYGAALPYAEEPDRVKRWNDEWDTFLTRLINKSYRLIDQSPRSKFGTVKPMRYIED